MRVPLMTSIVFLTLSASAQSSGRDSANFALLKDGQKLYSSRIQLKFTPAADKYLELSDHRQIPIEQVSRFKVPEGAFVIVPGSAGYDVYKVEKEGQRLSIYSRVVNDPAHASEPRYHGTVELYFRRTDQEKMTPANFHSLQNAIKDNPASLHELNLARNHYTGGLITTGASVLIAAVGLYITYHHSNPPPYSQPGPPPSPPSHTLSPLVVIGGGGIIGGLIIALHGNRNYSKALDIYNR